KKVDVGKHTNIENQPRWHSLFVPALVVILQLLCRQLTAQTTAHSGTLLIHCQTSCKVKVDGNVVANLAADSTKLLVLGPGQHLLAATGVSGNWSKVISVEVGKQTVADISFQTSGTTETDDADNRNSSSSGSKTPKITIPAKDYSLETNESKMVQV